MGKDFGMFGDLFDLNGDGILDETEKAMEFAAFSSMMDTDDEREENDEEDFEEDDFEEDDFEEDDL